MRRWVLAPWRGRRHEVQPRPGFARWGEEVQREVGEARHCDGVQGGRDCGARLPLQPADLDKASARPG